ncbi:MAG: hypothetical protein U5J78_03375 [Parasphingorhabdus sp.]|nr:hypothetical protein [Parasphingorhabdus sp.]
MNDSHMRAVFGVLTFAVVGAVVLLILSDWVSLEKEQIANVVLGNVLGWPAIVLAFYFGSSSGSKDKSEKWASFTPEQLTASDQQATDK